MKAVDTGTPLVLDPCCGSRMWWFDKAHPHAVYGDQRQEQHTLCDGRTLRIEPDQRMDFRALPFPVGDDAMRHMCTTFVDKLRECFKAGGFARKDGDAEKGGDFLVGFAGRLFRVCEDYQVAETAAGYEACGCGENIARGSLFSTRHEEDAFGRLELALRAAEAHSAGVRGPFHYAAIGATGEDVVRRYAALAGGLAA